MSKYGVVREISGSVGLLLVCGGLLTGQAFGQIEHNMPASLSMANDLGRVNGSTAMTLTVRLKMPNRAAFDDAVEALYNPDSPTYQHWMTDADLAQYAPPASQRNRVETELKSHGLTVLSEGPLGFSVRVQGTASQVESAFQTEIHQFSYNGKTFSEPVQQAQLTGGAAALVSSVSGLGQHTVRPTFKQAVNPRTGQPIPAVSLAKIAASGGLGSIITDQCLTAPATYSFTTPGASLPVGVYYGNVYAKSGLTCGFTASQLEAHYGLPAAYDAGLTGKGETVVLVEGYGYPTMESDANAFSKLMGLPQLTSSNFEIVYPEGQPVDPNAGILEGWNDEIALDIDWAHSMAPGAKIVVVATNGQDNEDFQASIEYVTDHKLGNSVSDSWEEDTDLLAGPEEQESYNDVLEMAVAKGISVQFSTGDDGDDGLGTPVGAPGVPSVAPYATAVGGTAILNKVSGSGQEELGWGDQATYLELGGAVENPPVQLGLLGGSGGGESVYWPKPSWQSHLPGSGRQVPDVSALADPYTGVGIVVTSDGVQGFLPGIGGTSLASPVFSAIWAIANQEAGHALGQAARTVATLSTTDAVSDVLPLSSPTDVAGTIFDASGAMYYSPTALFSADLYTQEGFTSAIWPIAAGDSVGIAFGTDSSLTVTEGWDNVTGYGVPNGLTFIKAAAGK